MSDAEMRNDDDVIKTDVDSEDSPLEDRTMSIVSRTGKTSFLQTQSMYDNELDDRFCTKLDGQEARGERHGSTLQESKLGSVKCVSVRNSLKPATLKTDSTTKTVERTQKLKFDVDPTSEAALEALRKQHPMAHVLTSIAAQVSAIQAKAADMTSKPTALASTVSLSQKYLLLPNELGNAPDVGEAMPREGLVESASEQVLDDMQVIEYTDGERETPAVETSSCLVCGDRGSGFHYSIYSCEGCKGFFKRTVQKNMAYTCKDSGTCFINKTTRNNCQACRFKKCIDVGMKKEAVREDRTPGGKHRLKRPRTEEAEMPVTISPSAAFEELILRLVEARPDMIPTIKELTMSSPPDTLDLNDFMHFGYMELRFIIDWAKKVPGFDDLILDDQMALLKSSFMELNLLRLAFRSRDCPDKIKFAKEIMLSANQCTHVGWGHDLLNCMLEFVSRLKNVNIDSTEFCILNAIVLTYPDAAGIVDKQSVTSLQNQMIDCLQHHSTSRYPNERRRSGLILLRLPTLRTISAKAAELFLSLSLEGNVKMNALVLEMMN